MALEIQKAPSLVRLNFLSSAEDEPAKLWKNCVQKLYEWKNGLSADYSPEKLKKYNGEMAARLVWETNLLEDTIPRGLSRPVTESVLTKAYNKESVPSLDTAGLSQMIQHLQAFKLVHSRIDKEFTEDMIKEAHRIMMAGLSNEQGIPVDNGEYRQSSVFAGIHQFPSHDCIQRNMTRIVREYNEKVSTADHDPYELASWLYFEVVSLHPFDDGNGRISRLLWCYSLMKDGIPFPVMLTSGHKKSQKHLVKCIKRDENYFFTKWPHLTTLTVISVALAWKQFSSSVDLGIGIEHCNAHVVSNE